MTATRTNLCTMPATEQSFLAPLPSQIYVDTDIVIAHLIAPDPHHERCRSFLQRIAMEGCTTLYISSLTWLEFANVTMKLQFRERLPDIWQQQFRFGRWQQTSVRRAYLDFLLSELERTLSQFSWYEVPLLPEIRATAMEYISMYNLRPHDAAHLASASSAGVSDMASLDGAFRPVDGLILWNDRIYADKEA